MIKNNQKGITLIALAVTIIVLLILISISTTTGLDVARDSKYYNAVAELKLMQTKTNEMYEEYTNGNEEVLNNGESINTNGILSKAQTAYESVNENKIMEYDIGVLYEYRYYSKEYIKETLDMEGIDSDFIINIKSRTVILLNGIEKDGNMYYSLNEIEKEQYNVQYTNTL